MIIALVLSIVFGMAVGILAARNKKAEGLVIPLLDVLQSIPILGFFPVVIGGIYALIPNQIGINLAVIFLIFTSMSWNIAFGVYEAVKSIPQDYVDMTGLTGAGALRRIRSLYIPASMSRIAYNTQTSWAVGLFYLISSEVLTLGNSNFSVTNGIGAEIGSLIGSPNFSAYVYSIVALLGAVVVWQFVFLREFSLWSEKYKFGDDPRGATSDPLMRFYGWVNDRSVSKLFLLRPGRGVDKVTSTLYKFRKGIVYAFLIVLAALFAFEAAALYPSLLHSTESLPSLGSVASTEGGVLVALATSFVRIWAVYALAVVVALPLGIAVALRRKLYDALVPVLETVASVPAPALLPAIYVVSMGNGEVVAAFVIFIGMIWYIVFNVMAGIRTLPEEIHELSKMLHLTRRQAWRHIYLPASATAFVTGSITAIGAAWNTLIVAEYFVIDGRVETKVGTGIGKTLYEATIQKPSADYLVITLSLISMTALVVAFNLTVWRRVYHATTKRYAYNR